MPQQIPTTIGPLLRTIAKMYPDEPAVVTRRAWGALESTDLTFRDVDQESQMLARQLLALGVTHQKPVGLLGWSSPDWLLLQLAITRIGAVLVPLNPLSTSKDVADTLQASGAALCVVLGNTSEDWPESHHWRYATYADHTLRTNAGTDIMDLPSEEHLKGIEEDQVLPTDLLQLQYTSGSTGPPKGAMLTHHGVITNAWLTAQTLAVRSGMIWGNPLPMFHVAGGAMVNLGALAMGATNCIIPRFAAATSLNAIESAGCHLFSATPTMITRMFDSYSESPTNVGTLQLITVGGSQIAPNIVSHIEQAWDVKLINIYGLSETSPVVSLCSPDDSLNIRSLTVGRALPLTNVRIADYDTGEDVSRDVPGEILVSGPGVMLGYLDNPTATTSAFRDGWFRTGDMGTLSTDGYLSVVGRYKNVIIRGGENVSPEEVELCLAKLEGVESACVVGIPDPDLGEVPWAAITLASDSAISESTLMERLATHLNKRKLPQRIVIMDQLPETGPGKIDRQQVHRILLDYRRSGEGSSR